MARLELLLIGVIGLLPHVSSAQTPPTRTRQVETYDRASVDGAGNLVIVTSGRKRIVVSKEDQQSSFAEPILSSDRTAVGAQAEFPNCCTSYDIPLQLVIYSNGKAHRFIGVGLPIFQWRFADGGTRVAFGQEPVHFGCSIHYELRDIESERLLDSADVPEACGQNPNPTAVNVPIWVSELNSDRKQ